jgi:hypothetical protein
LINAMLEEIDSITNWTSTEQLKKKSNVLIMPTVPNISIFLHLDGNADI